MWKSAVVCDAELERYTQLGSLDCLYGLSRFWSASLPVESYKANENWQRLLVFSDYGKRISKEFTDIREKYGDNDFLLALFCVFFHHDIFFDWRAADTREIQSLLAEEIATRRIVLPYRFGRLLYDRFNDAYQNTRTDHLSSQGVSELVRGTPQGVYQWGSILVGPLGVFEVEEPRLIPPSLVLPLWHCSDTGCGLLHNVRFEQRNSAVVIIAREIFRRLRDAYGPASEWRAPLTWLHRRGKWENGRPYYDLPPLIADCFVGSDRSVLFEMALQGSDRDNLRELISRPPRKKRVATGSVTEVASRISPEGQLQLLLTLSDKKLVELIDEALARKNVVVPIGEKRMIRYRPSRRGLDSDSEVSTLGIRSARDKPILNLLSVIWRSYESAGLMKELEWRVGSDTTRAPRETLSDFVRRDGPARIVKEIILASSDITKRVCEEINLSLKYVSPQDESAVDRLLWKLGFDPQQHDHAISRCFSRLKEFKDCVLSLSGIETENQREQIRSAGVNLFVSVEELLDKLISYNVWLVSGDHFLSGFTFSLKHARLAVAKTLGDRIGDAVWSSEASNTLGVALTYLAKSVEWVSGRVGEDPSRLERTDADLPHYVTDVHVPFPFRHIALWADCSPLELSRYSDGYSRIAQLLLQADLAGIRNSLDHHRDERSFPSSDKMLGLVARLEQAIELADVNRYLPKLFWLYSRKGTRFGLTEYEYQDYARRPLTVFGPPTVSGLPRQTYGRPVLIAPGNLIGYPNSALMFRFMEPSEYSNYWRDYPRRRRLKDDSGDEVSIDT